MLSRKSGAPHRPTTTLNVILMNVTFTGCGYRGSSQSSNHTDNKIIGYIIVAEYGSFLFAVIVAAIYFCYKCHQHMRLDSKMDDVEAVLVHKPEKKSHNKSNYKKNDYDFRRRPGQSMKSVWHMMGDSNQKDVYLHLLDEEDEQSSEKGSGSAGEDETKLVQN